MDSRKTAGAVPAEPRIRKGKNRRESGRPRPQSLAAAAAILSVLIVGCALCAAVSEESDASGKEFAVDGIGYKITGRSDAVVSSCTDEKMTEAVIPSAVTWEAVTYSVVSVGNYAFDGCSSLESAVIQDGVSSIGDYAFQYCGSLASVSLPDSIASIGKGAFYRCSSLLSVAIPDGTSSIGECAFEGCSSLGTAAIRGRIASVGDRTFFSCSSLTSVSLPGSVASIGSLAFYDCSSLSSIAVPDGVASIGTSAFEGCSSLTGISLPGSVGSIGDYAFDGCSSLSSAVLQDGIGSVGDFAFYKCSSLAEVSLPDSVSSIGKKAFSYCSSLSSIELPDSAAVGLKAFADCASLGSVLFGAGTVADPNAFGSTENYVFAPTAFYKEDGASRIDLSKDFSEYQGKKFRGGASVMARVPERTVAFDDGTRITEVRCFEGDPVPKPEDPAKTGYVFEYWAKEDGEEFDFAAETMPARNLVLRAVWESERFTVTYITGAGGDIICTYSYGTAIELPDGGSVFKSGHELIGWKAADGTEYLPGDGYTVTSDAEFTAVWKAAPPPGWEDDDEPCIPAAVPNSGRSRAGAASAAAVAVASGCAAALLAILAVIFRPGSKR